MYLCDLNSGGVLLLVSMWESRLSFHSFYLEHYRHFWIELGDKDYIMWFLME